MSINVLGSGGCGGRGRCGQDDGGGVGHRRGSASAVGSGRVSDDGSGCGSGDQQGPGGACRTVWSGSGWRRPVTTTGRCCRRSVWPGWEVVELNPAHVAEQRRVMGRRRVKTDAIDLEAITELLLAGRGVPVGEPCRPRSVSWRRGRRTGTAGWLTRTATKNQLLGQLDRCFPGLTLALPDVLGTKVGRLVAAAFRRPAPAGRARRGPVRPVRRRPRRPGPAVRWRNGVSPRPGMRLPGPDAAVARQVLAADLALLARPRRPDQLRPTAQLATLLPLTPFAPLTTVPGWGTVRAGSYGAAVGDPARWPGASAALPGLRAVPDAVRVRRQTPRRRDQPGRQRGAAPGADRPRHRAVAAPTRPRNATASSCGPAARTAG